MATTPANLRQTSFNVAATLVGAEVQAGVLSKQDEIREAFYGLADEVFEKLSDESTEDSGSKSGGSRSGSRSSSSKKSSKEVDLDDALETELKYGKFKGETLGDVAKMTKAKAAKFGYETGAGIKYIEWLAGNDDNEFLQTRAQAILDDRKES